ncbi:MAG: hypothetical protein E6H52_14540 [Betaproteobacteria bacterium]|nr:MAG: hypothetical protein E6H52_14540 [Betaproteobacteria bacterium]
MKPVSLSPPPAALPEAAPRRRQSGLPKDVFDGIRTGVLADRSKFFMDLTKICSPSSRAN